MDSGEGPAEVTTEPSCDQNESRRPGCYLFKRAETADEIEQIHRLNHAVFAVEVGQHEQTLSGRLVDKFHSKNIYYIALRRGEVAGMVAVHDIPPFSITDRLQDRNVLDGLSGRPLEVRLLAVRPGVRYGAVLAGLFLKVHEHARRHGCSHLLISGVGKRVRLYERLGFRALGPMVAGGAAVFVPMVLDLSSPPPTVLRHLGRLQARHVRLDRQPSRISLLPGPVEVSATVADAFHSRTVSHRDPEFIAKYERVRARLGALVGGRDVGLFAGGGTLANDVVAQTLAADPEAGRGLILANGEFGERLIGQARRARLEFDCLRWSWCRPWSLDKVVKLLDNSPAIRWVWCVHLETSTGMLNDLPGLVERLRPRGIRVCADVVSSLGALEVDLSGVHLAASAGGKSLGAYAGLGLVFAAPGACGGLSTDRVPACLDLSAALRTRGPGSTIGSPVVWALERALDQFETPKLRAERFQAADDLGRRLRRGLESLGLNPVVEDRWAAPVVTCFALPTGWTGVDFRAACRELNFEVATAGPYLMKRGWAQVATMGAVTHQHVTAFLDGLATRLRFPPERASRISGQLPLTISTDG